MAMEAINDPSKLQKEKDCNCSNHDDQEDTRADETQNDQEVVTLYAHIVQQSVSDRFRRYI